MYRLTFSPENDDGPLNVLALLTDYTVAFKKNGAHIDPSVDAWMIVGTEGYDTVVAVPCNEASWDAVERKWLGPTREIALAEFDEVEHL